MTRGTIPTVICIPFTYATGDCRIFHMYSLILILAGTCSSLFGSYARDCARADANPCPHSHPYGRPDANPCSHSHPYGYPDSYAYFQPNTAPYSHATV